MVRADFPYCYVNRKKLASGKFREYWRWRRDGQDTPLPGKPGDAAFHVKYAELMHTAEQRANAPDRTPGRHTFAWLAAAYLDSAEFNALADSTQADYRDTIDRRLCPLHRWPGDECLCVVFGEAVMDFDERKWRRGTIIRNIAVSPIVLLVRLPIMLVAIPMVWLGERIGRIGDALPGFRSLS